MHKTVMRVQWYDVDYARIVYFGNYFRFFTVAEEEFLRSMGINHKVLIKEHNIGFTRIEVICRYFKPARLDELIEIHTEGNLENDRFLSMTFHVFRVGDRVLLAEGMIRSACVSLGGQFRIVKMPKAIFETLSQVRK